MPANYNGRKVTVRHATDVDGEQIVYLSLAAGGEAKLLAETFKTLKEAGYSLRWTTLNARTGGYVVIPAWRASGSLLTAARVIAGAGPKQIVKYRDRNRLNLRRDNLYIEEGWAKRCDVAIPLAAGRVLPVTVPNAAASYAGVV